jgi:hypothetical protein
MACSFPGTVEDPFLMVRYAKVEWFSRSTIFVTTFLVLS